MGQSNLVEIIQTQLSYFFIFCNPGFFHRLFSKLISKYDSVFWLGPAFILNLFDLKLIPNQIKMLQQYKKSKIVKDYDVENFSEKIVKLIGAGRSRAGNSQSYRRNLRQLLSRLHKQV